MDGRIEVDEILLSARCNPPSHLLHLKIRQDRKCQDRIGQDRTGQDRTGQDRTGQDRTGQSVI